MSEATPPDVPAELAALGLQPTDLLWATWRPRPEIVRPAVTPVPFDQEACLARLAKLPAGHNGGPHWDKLPAFPAGMSAEEAHFWWAAFVETKAPPPPSPSALVERLRGRVFDGQVTPAEVAAQMTVGYTNHRWVSVIARVLGPTGLVRLLLDPGTDKWNGYLMEEMYRYLSGREWPFLSASELAALGDTVRAALPQFQWPQNTWKMGPPAFYLAALFGLHAELQALVESWPADRYRHQHFYDQQRPQRLVYGLGSAAAVSEQFRRLRLRLWRQEDLRAWMANTGEAGLDVVSQSLLRIDRAKTTDELLKGLRAASSPAVAPVMLDVRLTGKNPRPARIWLDEHPDQAVAGLAPLVEEPAPRGPAALTYLRDAVRHGHRDAVAAAAACLPPGPAAVIRSEVLDRREPDWPEFDPAETPEWLAAPSPAFKPPDWCRLPSLPAVVVGGRRLSQAQVTGLLGSIRGEESRGRGQPPSRLVSPSPLVDALRRHADPEVLEAFAWRLVDLWMMDGAWPADRWTVRAVGFLGGERSVGRLAELLRRWASGSQRGRAAAVLAAIARLGGDLAINQLFEARRRYKQREVASASTELLDALAAERGLSRDELEDSLVPALGLDSTGGRVFDYGRRQFALVWGPNLAPLVRLPDGKRKAELPRPGVRDDPALAPEAARHWREFKLALRGVVRVQGQRLEQAMLTNRRWSLERWRGLILAHPILGRLARQVLWAWHRPGEGAEAFRITDDAEFVGADDTRVPPGSGAAEVSVVHPARLSPAARTAWGEVFADYEIIQPFDQLGRPVFDPTPEEREAGSFVRVAGRKVKAADLARLVASRGASTPPWEYVYPQPIRRFFRKKVNGLPFDAVLEFDPGLSYVSTHGADQILARCFFAPAGKKEPAVPLTEIDPVAVSDILADLQRLPPAP